VAGVLFAPFVIELVILLALGSFNLKTAVDGREKAQKAQNEKDGVESVVTHSVRVLVSAKLSFFCAFCAFSWLTAFSRFKAPIIKTLTPRFEPNCGNQDRGSGGY